MFIGADIISENRRNVAGWTIMLTWIGAFVLSYAASNLGLPRLVVCKCYSGYVLTSKFANKVVSL